MQQNVDSRVLDKEAKKLSVERVENGHEARGDFSERQNAQWVGRKYFEQF